MKTNNQAIELLLEIEGYDDYISLLQDTEFGAYGVPNAICMNDDCSYTAAMEPDQDAGWCDECGTNSVKSLQLLVGII